MKRNLKIAGVLCILLALCLMVGCAETGIFRFIEVIDSLRGANDNTETENYADSSSENYADTSRKSENPTDARPNADAESWAIYWYLCASDLESNYAAATYDLYELQKTTLPDNVNVVIQTGGAKTWHHEAVRSGVLSRFLYSSDGLEKISELPDASMGDGETFADFISFCFDEYPADNTILIFWNHGGGSISGVAFDELHSYDSLSLDEIYYALDSACTLSEYDPPFELVGFDACLMATIDTAAMLSDVAEYMVASEDQEPTCGWDYDVWIQAVADSPDIGADEIGRIICDSYAADCEAIGMADEITLSVVDLSKIWPLVVAYDNLGCEALSAASRDPVFFAEFGRQAHRSENYGGNTPDTGYTNMVDLGHLVRNSRGLLPENAQAVLDALDECVVYKVNGKYRGESTGLSCYYAYDGDIYDVYEYSYVGASPAFCYLYDYELTGILSEEGLAYADIDSGAPAVDFSDQSDLECLPLYCDEDGYAVLDIGGDAASLLTGAYINLCYIDIESDIILILGRDNDLFADWENGVFRDNFRGVWGTLDGYLCHMEIVFEGDDYNIYSVPILLNGVECNLRVAYSFVDCEYSIIGARRKIDDNGMADKTLILPEPGDEITLLHSYMSLSDEDDNIYEFESATVVYTEDTQFYEGDMGDGIYALYFELVDITGGIYFTDSAIFTVEDGYIYTET